MYMMGTVRVSKILNDKTAKNHSRYLKIEKDLNVQTIYRFIFLSLLKIMEEKGKERFVD